MLLTYVSFWPIQHHIALPLAYVHVGFADQPWCNCHFWQPSRLCWANLRSRFPPAFSLPISVLPSLLSSNITLLVLSASGLLFGCSICPCFSYACCLRFGCFVFAFFCCALIVFVAVSSSLAHCWVYGVRGRRLNWRTRKEKSGLICLSFLLCFALHASFVSFASCRTCQFWRSSLMACQFCRSGNQFRFCMCQLCRSGIMVFQFCRWGSQFCFSMYQFCRSGLMVCQFCRWGCRFPLCMCQFCRSGLIVCQFCRWGYQFCSRMCQFCRSDWSHVNFVDQAVNFAYVRINFTDRAWSCVNFADRGVNFAYVPCQFCPSNLIAF